MPALLFDLDGTMLNTDPLHAAVFAELFAEHGCEIDEAFYFERIHGRLNRDIFAEFFPGENAEAMADDKEARARARLSPDLVMPGFAALVDRAEAENWPMAVVTNAPRANADAMMTVAGVAGRIGTLVLGDECEAGKPDPAPYREAMRRLGVMPDSAIAFEDSPSGVRSAHGAGARVIGLRSSLTDAALRQAGAHATIADFTDPALTGLLDLQEGRQ